MNTTIKFNYQLTKNYAIDLFNKKGEAYEQEKKVEALMILIGLDTGLRISDLLKLKYSDIDTNSQYGKPLLKTYVSKKKRYETKPLSTTTNRLIEVYFNYCKLKHTSVNPQIFFNYKNNKPYSRQWSHKRLNKANDAGELGKKVDVAGAHSLRRTAGGNIFDMTKDLRLTQSLLGHTRLSQTEHYLKLDETQALERLSNLYD